MVNEPIVNELTLKASPLSNRGRYSLLHPRLFVSAQWKALWMSAPRHYVTQFFCFLLPTSTPIRPFFYVLQHKMVNFPPKNLFCFVKLHTFAPIEYIFLMFLSLVTLPQLTWRKWRQITSSRKISPLRLAKPQWGGGIFALIIDFFKVNFHTFRIPFSPLLSLEAKENSLCFPLSPKSGWQSVAIS